MEGGRYITYFPDDEKRKLRVFLYKLESLGIARLDQEKWKEQGQYKYQWKLTEKGKNLINKDKNLQLLWKEGRILEFYASIKTLLEESS